jgi:hypothetical protein
VEEKAGINLHQLDSHSCKSNRFHCRLSNHPFHGSMLKKIHSNGKEKNKISKFMPGR